MGEQEAEMESLADRLEGALRSLDDLNDHKAQIEAQAASLAAQRAAQVAGLQETTRQQESKVCLQHQRTNINLADRHIFLPRLNGWIFEADHAM